VSGHPLAAGRAQDRESTSAKTDVLPLSQRHSFLQVRGLASHLTNSVKVPKKTESIDDSYNKVTQWIRLF